MAHRSGTLRCGRARPYVDVVCVDRGAAWRRAGDRVIHAPCDGEVYASAAGKGASLNGRKLSLDPSRTIRNAITGIGCNTYVEPERVGQIIAMLLGMGGNFIRNGSGALMLAYVAAGRLVGYYEPHMYAWDCMAGYCLVKEAGGDYLSFPTEGEALLKGHPVLASNPTAYADPLAAIEPR